MNTTNDLVETFLELQHHIACPRLQRARDYYYQFIPKTSMIIDAGELRRTRYEHCCKTDKMGRIIDGYRFWWAYRRGQFYVPITANVLLQHWHRYGKYLYPTQWQSFYPVPLYVYHPHLFDLPVNSLDECLNFIDKKGTDLTGNDELFFGDFFGETYTINVKEDREVRSAIKKLGFEKDGKDT